MMTKNSLETVLNSYEDKIGGKFKPDQRFYSRVDINQKRFGQLVRGEKPILGYEAKNLANYFGINVDELL